MRTLARIAGSCLLTTLWLSPTLSAQYDNGEAELGRLQRQQMQKRSDVEQLLDLRIRHDLGLPMPADAPSFEPATPATSESLARAANALQGEEITTNDYRQRLARLKAELQQRQALQAAKRKPNEPKGEWVTMPKAGVAQMPFATLPPAEPSAHPNDESTDPAAAQEQPANPPTPAVTVVPNLDPIRGQIQGSTDNSLVAQALFRAAQALLDRGAQLRSQALTDAAQQCDLQAKDRLVRALDTLNAAIGKDAAKADFADLFYLGKCRELLFRIDERLENLTLKDNRSEYQRREQEVREPFLQIDARDFKVVDGKDVPGAWAMAARTASEHFRWMNLNAGYKPKIALESLSWEPQQQ